MPGSRMGKEPFIWKIKTLVSDEGKREGKKKKDGEGEAEHSGRKKTNDREKKKKENM